MKEFRIEGAFDQRTRQARNVRVNIDSYHSGATGGGFLFFEVRFDPHITHFLTPAPFSAQKLTPKITTLILQQNIEVKTQNIA